ncbi:Pkinase-domain-containing protein, partial [Metschnikowia bicuspidata var. bicuspidata NRRL YB-4993]
IHSMSRIFSSDQLDVCEEVGRGGFGVVFRGIVKATGQEVAIKQIDLEHELADFFEVNREIQILSECRSPQITQYLGCFVKGYKLWVIMEFVDGGSLFELLMPGPVTDEKTILIIAGEILLALLYLHELGKIHRDLKSQNILFNQNGEVKLADFGVSTQLYSNFSRRNTTVGTPYWMAPEVIMNNTGGHSFKADIWSLGCCIFELRSGKPPLQDHYTPMQALRKISSCKKNADFVNFIDMAAKDDWSDTLKDFLASCFSVDPRNRPSALRLLQHDFILGKHDLGPEACKRRLKKLITRKRLWDQQNHVVKSHRIYAPTEISQNQNKWKHGGSPQKETKSIRFDFSTIKDAPELPSETDSEHKKISVSPSRSDSSGGARQDASKNNKAMKADFRKVLNRVFTKLELRTALSTSQYDQIVTLNDKLLDMFTPVSSADPSGSQSKILVCQYLKYLLKEVSKQAPANKLQLQKAIVPSQYLQQASSTIEPVKKQAPTSMDEIERSLLGSWLDKLEK